MSKGGIQNTNAKHTNENTGSLRSRYMTRSKWWRQNYKDLYGTLLVRLKTKENVLNSQQSLHFT